MFFSGKFREFVVLYSERMLHDFIDLDSIYCFIDKFKISINPQTITFKKMSLTPKIF